MKKLLIILQLLAVSALAQVEIDVPLTVTDGVNSIVLHFGIRLNCSSCCFPVPGDTLLAYCMDSTIFLPPVPPSGVFDARFVWPRGGTFSCLLQGLLSDVRCFRSFAHRDTFKVKTQLGTGTFMRLSWPPGLSAYFTQLILRYFDQDLGSNVNINMLTDTTADVTSAGDPATVNIYSGGLVVTVSVPESGTPGRFVLNQNYPNPFNPSTEIRFGLAAYGHVSLKVYDVLGREVATLVDGHQESGEHVAEWKAEGMPSGVYIYRLTTAEGTVARKMLLLR